jgi:hypothetical protein
MRYVIFRILLSMRKLVRMVTTLCIIIAIIIAISNPLIPYKNWYIILLGVVPFLIRIYYDKLLFRVKPEDMDLYLSS